MVFVSELGLPRLRSFDHARSTATSVEPTKNDNQAVAPADSQRGVAAPAVSHAVPVYGADDTQQTTVAVNTRQPDAVGTTTAPATQVSVVQLETAAQDAADRLAAVRGTLMVAVDHDRRVTDLLLDSLLLHGQARRSVEQLTELAKKTERQLAHISGAYVTHTMQRAESSVRELEEYIHGVVSDYVALRKLINKLQHTTTETRRALSSITRARELAERRAYLRAAVHQVQLRLQQFPELSVHERSVREQLQPFAALDEFANLPETREEQQALAATLDTLEPIYARLQESIAAIMERPLPSTDPTSDDELQADNDWWQTNAVRLDVDEPAVPDDDFTVAELAKAATDPAVEVTTTEDKSEEVSSVAATDPTPQSTTATTLEPEATDAAPAAEEAHTSPASPEPATAPEPATVAEQLVDIQPAAAPSSEPAALSEGLGYYRLQRGDTLVDLLLGDTDAGILPAMVEIPPSYISTLAELVRAYLDQYRTVREYLGTREAIDVWAMRGSGHPQISLDNLNDIVMYVAVRNDLLSIADTAWKHLATTLGQLEEQANALEATLTKHALDFTPQSVRQRAQGQGRGVRWANFGRQHTTTTMSATTMSTRSQLPEAAQTAWQQVVDDVYAGDESAYETDFTTWVDTLFLAPRNREHLVGSVFGKGAADSDPRQDFLALRFSDWYSLLHDTSLRYEWLQRHMVPASTWRDWSRQVLTWQRVVQAYPRETVRKLPLLAVAELVFINRSLRPTAR